MNFELLEKLIPQRQPWNAPNAPSQRLLEMQQSLFELRELLLSKDLTMTAERRAALEKQEKLFAAALEG